MSVRREMRAIVDSEEEQIDHLVELGFEARDPELTYRKAYRDATKYWLEALEEEDS